MPLNEKTLGGFSSFKRTTNKKINKSKKFDLSDGKRKKFENLFWMVPDTGHTNNNEKKKNIEKGFSDLIFFFVRIGKCVRHD